MLLVALAPLLLLGVRTYRSAEISVAKEVFAQMEAVAGYKRIIIENWLNERRFDLTATLHAILISGGDLHSRPPSLFSDLGSNNFDAIAIITTDQYALSPGCTIEDSLWATSLQKLLPTEQNAPKDTAIYGRTEYDPRIGTWFTLLKAYPTLNGNYMIAAGKVLISSSLDDLLRDSIGLGQSGQSYLIDRNGLMLTASRFQHHPAAGTHTMSSLAIDSALAGFSGVGFYVDWQGKRVLGAWSPVAGTGWALIAEMDEREALMPINRLRIEWLVMAIIVFLLSGLAAFIFSKSLSKPILNLAEASRSVAKGDLTVRLGTHRKDELGELASSFDGMVESLKNAQEELAKSYRALLEKEKLVIHTEKLAAIGELVASIVHEIRNPLSAVKMNVGILAKSAPPESVQSDQFAIARDQIERMETMLKAILNYSKPMQIHPTLFSLTELLAKTTISFANNASKQLAKIEFTTSDSDISVFGDPELLTQSISNIIENSLVAMPESGGGIISISHHYTAEMPKMVKIEITDNGKGIPPAVMERIFEPFFTTRPNGTGLGLPNIRKVIDLHRGSIEIFSKDGQGTQVILYIPAGTINA